MKKVTMPGARPSGGMGAMGQRRPRSAAMIGRMAREGMPAPGVGVGGAPPGLGGPKPLPRGGRPAPIAPKSGINTTQWQAGPARMTPASMPGGKVPFGLGAPAVRPALGARAQPGQGEAPPVNMQNMQSVAGPGPGAARPQVRPRVRGGRGI
jgi:hypothetical protein